MSPHAQAWAFLVAAGVLEVVWAVGLKATEGFTRLRPSIIVVAAMVASFALLGQALKTLPVGTAYAVWTGIGTVGAATWGILVLKEPAGALRVACLVMIVAGIAGLKLLSHSTPSAAS